MTNNEKILIEILQNRLPKFSLEQPLHEQLDSIEVVSLILDIERTMNVKLDLNVFGKRNLQSVQTLSQYIERVAQRSQA